MKRIPLLSLVAVLFLVLVAVRPSANAAAIDVSVVRILAADGTQKSSFLVPTANATGGLSVAVADLGTDGTPEILVGNGLGNEPRVHVFRADGSEIGSFLAYDQSMGVGVNVVACDLDGDGTNEIVTSPQRGGGPHVRTFDRMGRPIDPGFFAYDQSMREGVNLACGDLDGDGRAEVVTLPAAGGGPHVRVWDETGDGIAMTTEFFSGDAADRRGLVGVVTNGTLSVAPQIGSETTVVSYVIHSPVQSVSESPTHVDALGVTSLASFEGTTLLATSQGASLSGALSIDVADAATGSVTVAIGDLDRDGTDDLVVADAKPFVGEDADGKRIVVSLSEQRVYAYENGLLSNSFLVSTARPPYQTPVGEHAVLAKIPLVHYAGGTGADAYDLGWVPYNLRFYPHIYIHYAPWHNNFGHVMSHGCVNVGLENMKWIYDWSDVGIPVIVQS